MATIIKKFWSDEDNPKLTQLVKENVILWDVQNDEYKLSERKPVLWKKISEDFRTDSGDHTIHYYSSIYLVNPLLHDFFRNFSRNLVSLKKDAMHW